MTAPRGAGLTRLEISSGLVFGVGAPNVDTRARFPSPRAALEAAVRTALARPPCLVSFSGGRDSSGVLSLAVNVARREALPLPVPATFRFPGLADADETEWQEAVVRSLGLDDWLRLEQGDELDVVGPISTAVLRRHGLLWPFNVHFHVPLLEAAAGGALLTGAGGDEVFAPTYWDRFNRLLAGERPPEPRDVLRLVFALTPRQARRALLRRSFPMELSWLRPDARREVANDWATELAQERRRYGERPSWWLRTRAARTSLASLGALATDADVLLVHPFADPAVADAIRRTPEMATADRRGRMLVALGDSAPAPVLGRESKASFDGAFWTERAQAFAKAWNGEGVDSELVDGEVLKRLWNEGTPPAHTFTLLQSVWLESVTRGTREEPPLQDRATTSGEGGGARNPAVQPA